MSKCSPSVGGDFCTDCMCDGMGYTCDEYYPKHPPCPRCWKQSGEYEDFLDSMPCDPDSYSEFCLWGIGHHL